MSRSTVYVIGWGSTPVKIGQTWDVKKRMAALQVGNPYELRIIHGIEMPTECAVLVEKAAHAALAEHRLKGEWFAIDAAVAFGRVDQIAKTVVEARAQRLEASNDLLRSAQANLVLTDEAHRAISVYREALAKPGQPGVAEMNLAILKSAGLPALEVFKLYARDRNAILKGAWQHRNVRERAEQALVNAANALGAWWANTRQPGDLIQRYVA